MSKLKLKGKDLRSIGYPEGPVISIAMQVMEKNYKHSTLDEALEILKKIQADPEVFSADEVLGKIAKEFIEAEQQMVNDVALLDQGIHYNVFGAEHIEEGAIKQMQWAAKLPVAVAGALMPDAHHGYGLPIGGVLAVENAVIPYGVGVDIGCRMCLSLYDINPQDLVNKESFFARELNEATLFGAGREFEKNTDHEVLDSPLFGEIDILKNLQKKAARQLGSSGSGNHFVEFGIVEIAEYDAVLNVPAGTYVGVLSHSGSRALGAIVAGHYTQVAKQLTRLQTEAANLAWLSLDSEAGMEYWLAMNLAGEYASACHHIIHKKLAKQLGRQPLMMVENHHNFAWKEKYDGREVIVHRKGATPAGKNVLGIIPGSMTAPGYIVKGKGELASINSASHGAGRKMSRTKAMQNITQSALKAELQKHGVKLIGAGLDEAPFAYKNIDEVMQSQKALVDVVGKFTPKIVKMDGSNPKVYGKQGKDVGQ
jgi:tRNA-splicing ligase RtcB